MPINASIYFLKAEQEYHEAQTTEQKLKALKKMLSLSPGHKGAEKLRKDIKERIRRLKYLSDKEKQQKKGGGYSIAVRKEGAAQIAFVGLPNSGKSTLLSKLSGKPVEIADYPFTTKLPAVRMIPFENIQLQGIEIPALYPGIDESSRGRQMISLIKTADFLVVVVREKSEISKVAEILESAGIKLGAAEKHREGFVQYMPSLEVAWADFDDPELIKKIWLRQGKIRVQTKGRGQKAADKPVVMKEGETVGLLASIVHKDFVRKFKYARVWGDSADFAAQVVGLNHKLKDGDTVELFTK